MAAGDAAPGPVRPLRSPNPFETCPECGARPHVPHHQTCRYSYDANRRSKLLATEQEAHMHETPDPQPVPVPGDPDPDDGGDNGDE
jgi:hypothetical protein